MASGILGDGYEDVAKHALLLHMATLALGLLGVGRLAVTAPPTRQVDGPVYALRGWALDPFGVDAVVVAAYASLDAKAPLARWEVPASGVTTGAFGESLRRYYPTYPDSARGGFAVDVPR